MLLLSFRDVTVGRLPSIRGILYLHTVWLSTICQKF